MTPEGLREKVARVIADSREFCKGEFPHCSDSCAWCDCRKSADAAISVCMEAAAGIIRDHADSWRADGDKAIGEQGNGSHGIWCLDVARDFELAGTKIRSLVPEKETP